ncbi:hypothetical protein [Microcystis phage Mae-JY02]
MTPTTLAAALLRDVPHDYNENGERVMLETEVLAALSRALDPALTERAGEVVADLRDDAQWGTPICTEAADLITALLAQNAALRAERDAAREQARSNSFAGEGYVFMQQRAEAAEAEVEKLRAERDELSSKLEVERALTDAVHRLAKSAEARIATLTARVEGLTGALEFYAEDGWKDRPLDPPTPEEVEMFGGNILDFPMPEVFFDRGERARAALSATATTEADNE